MLRIVRRSPADRPFAEVFRAFLALVLPTRGAGMPLDDVLFVADEAWNHFGPDVSGQPFPAQLLEELTPAERAGAGEPLPPQAVATSGGSMRNGNRRVLAVALVVLGFLGALLLFTTEPVPPDAVVSEPWREGDPELRGAAARKTSGGVSALQAAVPALWVQVRTLSGDRPIAGARVDVRAKGAVVAQATTDDEGRVSMDDVPTGSLQLAVRAVGFVSSEAAVMHTPGCESTTVSLHLAHGHPVRGRVIDDLGRPVAGALVLATSAVQIGRARVPEQRATTGADGRFVFASLPAGEQVLVARWSAGWGGRGQRVRVPFAGAIDLLLARGAVVAGTVTSAVTGAGIAEAEVAVSDISYSARVLVRTDAEGRYQIGPFDPRRPPVYLRVTADGYRPATQEALVARGLAAPHPFLDGRTVMDLGLGPDDRVALDIALAPGAVRVGRVGGTQEKDRQGDRRADGRGAAGADAADADAVPTSRAILAVRGRLSSRHEAELRGAYVQVAWVDRSGFALDPVGRWKLWAGATRHPVRRDGTFSVSLSGAPGRFAVRASALGHMPTYSADQRVAEDTTEAEVDLRLAPGRRLAGTVLDALTSEPVVGARLRIVASDAAHRTITMWHAIPAVSDGRGAFSIGEIPDGPQLLEVSATGYASVTRRVEVSRASGEVRVRLMPADGRLAGVVEHDAGGPFAGARVYVRQERQASRRVRTGDDGAFVLEGLPRAPATVAARADGHIEARAVDVPIGTLDLRFVLERGVAAAGVVLDGRGQALPNTWIEFVPVGGSHGGTWVRTDAKGRFRRTDLARGTHEIRVRAERSSQVVGRVVLPNEDLVVRR